MGSGRASTGGCGESDFLWLERGVPTREGPIRIISSTMELIGPLSLAAVSKFSFWLFKIVGPNTTARPCGPILLFASSLVARSNS